MKLREIHGVCFFLAAAGLWWLLSLRAVSEERMSVNKIEKGLVTFDVPANHLDAVLSWSLTIDKPDLVKLLLEDPLKKAVLDEQPSDYAFLGGLRIEHGQDHEDIVLYHPFGHFKRQGKYYVGKFDDLRDEIEEFYKNAIRPIVSRK